MLKNCIHPRTWEKVNKALEKNADKRRLGKAKRAITESLAQVMAHHRHLALRAVHRRIVKLHDAWGKMQEADRWRKRIRLSNAPAATR